MDKNAVQSLQISALVPIRSESGSLGVIFIEDVGDLNNRDTTQCRHELDFFGAQAGLLVQRKHLVRDQLVGRESSERSPAQDFIYKSGSFNIEPVSWLRIWTHGAMRTKREVGWYLGLQFGPDHYVMVYNLMTGPESASDRLATMLWHHILVMRSMAIASGRNDIEAGEIRDDLAGLISAAVKSSNMESISLAFTVFNRARKTASSGHFGPSRPFVVGAENLVTPYNDVVVHLASGRDLRYWEVVAELSGDHTWLLSYDTSKLDGIAGDTLVRRGIGNLANASSSRLHSLMEDVVLAESLPRYYVAAIMNPENAVETEQKQEVDQKAG